MLLIHYSFKLSIYFKIILQYIWIFSGDVILREEPYAAVLESIFRVNHCAHCLRKTSTPIPCYECATVITVILPIISNTVRRKKRQRTEKIMQLPISIHWVTINIYYFMYVIFHADRILQRKFTENDANNSHILVCKNDEHLIWCQFLPLTLKLSNLACESDFIVLVFYCVVCYQLVRKTLFFPNFHLH